MRPLTLLVALTLATTTLAMLVPAASAVGTCTKLTNAVTTTDCPYLFCYGTSWSYPDRYYRCYECFDPSRPECDWPRPILP